MHEKEIAQEVEKREKFWAKRNKKAEQERLRGKTRSSVLIVWKKTQLT